MYSLFWSKTYQPIYLSFWADALAHYLECGATGTKEEIAAAITEVEDYQQKFLASRIKYDWENDKSTALDSQWKKVSKVFAMLKVYLRGDDLFSLLFVIFFFFSNNVLSNSKSHNYYSRWKA